MSGPGAGRISGEGGAYRLPNGALVFRALGRRGAEAVRAEDRRPVSLREYRRMVLRIRQGFPSDALRASVMIRYRQSIILKKGS